VAKNLGGGPGTI